jgi:cell division protein FtsQ
MTPVNRRLDPKSAGEHTTATGSRRNPSPSHTNRWFSALRTIFGASLVMAASIGLAWTVRHYMTHSPRFSVTEIRVVGGVRRSADAVIAESGLSVASNVFSIDLDVARNKIASDPWIDDVSLARNLPATIVIHVRERVAAGLIALDDLQLATADGEPFKRLEPGDPVDLPIVTGIRSEGLADDHEGTVRTIRRAIGLAAEYANSSLAARAPLEEVHVSPDGSFSIVVGRGALPISLGSPPFRRKLDEASRVFTELEKRGAHAGALLLDNDAHPERVVVRMK